MSAETVPGFAGWHNLATGEYYIRHDDGRLTKHIDYSVAEQATLQQAPTTGDDMDLGTIGGSIIDIGLEALRSRVVQQPQTQFVSALPSVGRVGAAAAGAATGLGVGEVLDFPTRKKRRRRRRLATVSDIKDLAALKAVLGNGEAFKTWIATHSR